MGKTKTDKANPAVAGQPMSEEDFRNMIKTAEKGPFVSVQDAGQIIDKWKLKYAK